MDFLKTREKKMSKFLEKVKSFFGGDYSRELLTKYLAPLLLINFFLWILIAILGYPGYDMTRMDISYLSIIQKSPYWIAWSIGMISTGNLMLSVVSHFRKNMDYLPKKGVWIMIPFFYLSSYGIIGLGLIPINYDYAFQILNELHLIHAIAAFGGFYFGFWIWILMMIIKKERRKDVIIPSIFAFGPVIGLIITQLIRIALNMPLRDAEIWILRFSFWEWMLLFGVLGAFMSLLYVTRDDV